MCFFESYRHHRDLHSFPTRRSSDLAVAGELKRLTRILFVEKFGETKEFKKNKEIAQYLQSKLRSEEHTSELQSLTNLVCRLLLEKKKQKKRTTTRTSDGNV